uniref:carbamoyltransferase N-terminal domain-containing protein n=1 Tax=Mycetohabitans endofungorum TaxID=417203 RepID=UPI00396A147B
MKILGINSAYHESSASIVIDGKIVAAAEEERFTRIKHAKEACVSGPAELPKNSELVRASAHWLRHTADSHQADGGPICARCATTSGIDMSLERRATLELAARPELYRC